MFFLNLRFFFKFVLITIYFLVYDKFEQGATDIGSNILGWVAGSFYIYFSLWRPTFLKGLHTGNFK